MLFFLDNLLIPQESVSLQCVFHSIRFKVNKGWSTAVLLFLCPYLSYLSPFPLQKYIFTRRNALYLLENLVHAIPTRMSNSCLPFTTFPI